MALNGSFKRIVALAGGVGGAKLVAGLAACLPSGALTVIGNTGDDFRHYGLHVSPDLDTVMYTLAGIAHPINGWGIADDTRYVLDMLAHYGEAIWFSLGDRDLATNILRTHWLAQGWPLSRVTARLCQQLGIATRLLPMTDDPLATVVYTLEHGRLAFQEYFVRHRWQPTVQRLVYEGAETAQPAEGVLEALHEAEAIIICPSNPLLSIEPILQVRAIREALRARRAPCLAVSPIINGAALKGPTVKIMHELGLRADVVGVAEYYGDLIDALIIDEADRAVRMPQQCFVTNIRMLSSADRRRLAEEVLMMLGEVHP
ncbi:MAG: 2-phospho-L-lactate transferase [Candidatus Thermofonsia Clade 1 bacterium]|jgi:LPPG:FO 2-phospho-L-lactate transferase|uniref:2-phospho-L-lactate transferase n=1 Tax=Candidatus Thermofonsia Clade 1 bacterium TaxID=2364210 RepID=A0A2M8PCK5_9CHLR|nr:MAG: 2-phospho-L-lactate transferase [Candidatus Thermofonsia Clade 1 bacterium]RMF50633.1 MAG: 2-phospho-L-lactate transferase [Chloroflexota bacterium]